jgi:hypothetical protein
MVGAGSGVGATVGTPGSDGPLLFEPPPHTLSMRAQNVTDSTRGTGLLENEAIAHSKYVEQESIEHRSCALFPMISSPSRRVDETRGTAPCPGAGVGAYNAVGTIVTGRPGALERSPSSPVSGAPLARRVGKGGYPSCP